MRVIYVMWCAALGVCSALSGGVVADDWPGWRGPLLTGVSLEEGLPAHWSTEGQSLLWRADFTGRSTPVVFDGRVYVVGRTGKDVTEQERVACFDAETGALIWDHSFNVFHTTIPFNRVGWASPAADPETGYVYAHGVGGLFFCFDRDGRIVWSKSLTEEYGRISGYGGRTHTPFVEGDLVLISYLSTGWGKQGIPRHRYFAFDKRTGDLVWISTPGGPPKDTTYAVPVIAQVGGQRALLVGDADGSIYALNAATGRKIWGFKLSQRGINSSPVTDGRYVYASHSEENIDNTSLGRVVAIDLAGVGDITGSNEVWRFDNHMVGYTSPVLHDGKLYVIDNSANVHCLDTRTGSHLWEHNVGTVGKGSAAYGDGKLYVPEVNGGFTIVDVSGEKPITLDRKRIERAPGQHAEIYGSPAIANGRIYFTTEEGLYCLGGSAPSSIQRHAGRPGVSSYDGSLPPAHVQIRPAEIHALPGDRIQFAARYVNERGQDMWGASGKWGVEGLKGTVEGDGVFTVSPDVNGQTGRVTFSTGDFEATARVRVSPWLPYYEDFEALELGTQPSFLVGGFRKFRAIDTGEGRVLMKPPSPIKLHRSSVFFGAPSMSGYTIQADVKGTRDRRVRSDVGLISHRYIVHLLGNHQRLQIVSWLSDLRMAKTVDFAWDEDTWYTMKVRVDQEVDRAIVRAKVWRTGFEEPATWTIEAEDPLPLEEGSPGLYGYSPTNVYYDNLKVW